MDVVIAGYGHAGERHAALLAGRPGVRITGVVDNTAARRAAASARFPRAVVANRLKNLDTPADMVVVCTPPARHAVDIRTALIQHRAHVLCEKPAVLNPNDGRRLAHLAADAGLTLHPVHNYLHSRAVNELRATSTRVTPHVTHVAIEIVRTEPANGHPSWRPTWRTEPAAGGGILYDHGPHACYLAAHLARQQATSVSCSTTPGEHGADHVAQLWLQLADGATAAITLSWNGTTRTNSYELRGTNGTVRLRNGQLSITTPTYTGTRATEDHASGGHTHNAWTEAVHQAFLDDITGIGTARNPWDTAIHVADILHAAHASASTDQRPRRLGGPTDR